MREVNLRGVDLNLLVLLDALLEHRNVTRAAAAANISQPAMSRALGRLRALLHDPLLARASHGLVPTPAALTLQPLLRRVLADASELVSQRRFDPGEWRGQVGIAATDHQTILLLPSLMRRISQEAPHLDVRVVPFLGRMLDDLRDGRLNLSFGIVGQDVPPGLRQEPLYRDRFVTVLRAGHPAVADWTLPRFAGLDHVLVTVRGDGHGAMDTLLRDRGMSRRVALRLPHFFAALAVVAASDLVVTLPRSIALRHAMPLGLLMVEPPVAPEPFTTTVVWPDVFDADPANRWLRTLVRDEARRIDVTLPLEETETPADRAASGRRESRRVQVAGHRTRRSRHGQ